MTKKLILNSKKKQEGESLEVDFQTAIIDAASAS